MALPREKPFTIVQLIHSDETGDSYYRMRWPGEQVASQAPAWSVINLDASAAERFQWASNADLLVLFQSMDSDLLPIIAERRQKGLPTLVEYNDNFYQPPQSSPVAKDWRSPLLWGVYEKFMRMADCVMVTGPGLRELFESKVATPIRIIENQLPEQPPPFSRKAKTARDPVILGWAGSVGHMADFLWIQPTIAELVDAFPNLYVHYMGSESLSEYTRLPIDRVRFSRWGTMPEYYRFWEGIDIGLCPALKTAYNLCRSDIKPLEICSRGALPLVSTIRPYEDLISEHGLRTFRSLDELASLLSAYLQEPAQITADAQQAYQSVCHDRVMAHRYERLELYESLLESREVPQLSEDRRPPAGFQSSQGKMKAVLKREEIQKKAARLEKSQKYPDALQVLADGVRQNPHDPELTLGYLQLSLRCAADRTTLFDQLNAYAAEFPGDLRFLLLVRATITDQQRRFEVWQRVAFSLEEGLKPYREYFEAFVVPPFIDDLAKAPGYLPLGVALLRFYPNSRILRMKIAELLEKNGNHLEALTHYEWLAQDAVGNQPVAPYDSIVPRHYVEVWAEALRGRVNRS